MKNQNNNNNKNSFKTVTTEKQYNNKQGLLNKNQEPYKNNFVKNKTNKKIIQENTNKKKFNFTPKYQEETKMSWLHKPTNPQQPNVHPDSLHQKRNKYKKSSTHIEKTQKKLRPNNPEKTNTSWLHRKPTNQKQPNVHPDSLHQKHKKSSTHIEKTQKNLRPNNPEKTNTSWLHHKPTNQKQPNVHPDSLHQKHNKYKKSSTHIEKTQKNLRPNNPEKTNTSWLHRKPTNQKQPNVHPDSLHQKHNKYKKSSTHVEKTQKKLRPNNPEKTNTSWLHHKPTNQEQPNVHPNSLQKKHNKYNKSGTHIEKTEKILTRISHPTELNNKSTNQTQDQDYLSTFKPTYISSNNKKHIYSSYQKNNTQQHKNLYLSQKKLQKIDSNTWQYQPSNKHFDSLKQKKQQHSANLKKKETSYNYLHNKNNKKKQNRDFKNKHKQKRKKKKYIIIDNPFQKKQKTSFLKKRLIYLDTKKEWVFTPKKHKLKQIAKYNKKKEQWFKPPWLYDKKRYDFNHTRSNLGFPIPPSNIIINYKTFQIFFGIIDQTNFYSNTNFTFYLNVERVLLNYHWQ